MLKLWAENIEKTENKDNPKVWEKITCALNEKEGIKKTVNQCQRKVRHLKNQGKDRKDWNRLQSGGNLRKSPHYDLIDTVLGCHEIITFSYVIRQECHKGKKAMQVLQTLAQTIEPTEPVPLLSVSESELQSMSF